MAARRVPQSKVPYLVEAHLLGRMGRSNQEAREAFHADLYRPDRIPAYPVLGTAMSLMELGLKGLAIPALETGVSTVNDDDRVSGQPMARIYIRLAEYLKDDLELEEEAVEVLLMSTRLHPMPLAYNRLSKEALEREDYEQSAEYLEQSLRLDPDQAGVHATLGQVAARMDDPATALQHFRRALELNPALEDRLRPWVSVRRAPASGCCPPGTQDSTRIPHE